MALEIRDLTPDRLGRAMHLANLVPDFQDHLKRTPAQRSRFGEEDESELPESARNSRCKRHHHTPNELEGRISGIRMGRACVGRRQEEELEFWTDNGARSAGTTSRICTRSCSC
jgi:hypothetical protein